MPMPCRVFSGVDDAIIVGADGQAARTGRGTHRLRISAQMRGDHFSVANRDRDTGTATQRRRPMSDLYDAIAPRSPDA
ncbi:MAG: hypothetical protein DMF94_02090 [Acidobacteria bacterium]|nr:MAG: hypothetical protein DMF94_02090 [Acidobacteriota bacterium]